MAYYAFLDAENIVVEVIRGRDETEIVNGISDWEAYYSTKREGLTAKRTSFNTRGGQHILGGEPFRGNYAGVGYEYRADLDAFIPPRPFDSWILDETTFRWVSPVALPADASSQEGDGLTEYVWDESVGEWMVSE